MTAIRSEKELRARLAVLDTKIAAAPGWGAAVGAMDEERREIKRALARVTLKPNVERDPQRAAAIAELQRAQANVSRALDYLMGPKTVTITPPPRGPTPAYARGVAALPLPSIRPPRKWPWQREFWR